MRLLLIAAVVAGLSMVLAGKLQKNASREEIVAAFDMMNKANLGSHYEEQVKPMEMKFGWNASVYFDIGNNTGVVFRGSTANIVAAVNWSDENDLYLVVNISPPGAGVYLSSCNGSAINLKASTTFHEIKLSKKLLTRFDCLDLHLIRTEGTADGMVEVVVKPRGWYHIQLIIGVLVALIILIVLFRQCINFVLGFVSSYSMMEELPIAERECH